MHSLPTADLPHQSQSRDFFRPRVFIFKLNCLGGRKEREREHYLGEEGKWLAAVHPGVDLFSELLSLTVSGQLAVNGPLAQIFDPHTPLLPPWYATFFNAHKHIQPFMCLSN